MRRWTCSWPRGHDIMTRPTSTVSTCFSSFAWTQKHHDSVGGVLITTAGQRNPNVTFIGSLKSKHLVERPHTLTNEVEGNVAKSDETRAPGCRLTTCSATSPWQKQQKEGNYSHLWLLCVYIFLYALRPAWFEVFVPSAYQASLSGTEVEPSVPEAEHQV